MRMARMKKQREKGIALFMALLVVTIATLLATEMWFNNELDVARSHNNRSAFQANHYAKGMVLWAADVLRQDFENDSTYDNRSDVWNSPIAGVTLPDATLSGQLSDVDGKYNLNNLVINGQIDDQHYDYFKRIIFNLELEASIADKIIDWMDQDQVPRPMGVEDNYYLARSPSYRTAGQHFSHISELKLVDGINETIYQRLKNHVTVLPLIGEVPTKLNINTASTLLLLSLDQRIKRKEALVLYKDGYATYKSLNDFFIEPAIKIYHLENPEFQMSRLISTTSQWFQAEVVVEMEEVVFKQYAMLHRLSSNSIVKQWSKTPFL